jgi:plasmid maintenance system antidote protein VapI
MDTARLAQIMEDHEIRHRDLALIAGRTERAVSMWVNGHRPVPRAVAFVLLALDHDKISPEWLAYHLRKMKAEC